MKKPVIGIPSKIQNRQEGDLWHRQEIADELRYLIVRHGGIAIMLMPSKETMDFNESDLGDDKILTAEQIEDLHAQVDLCDGILLQGGDYSNAYEVEIARYALEKDIPLMGFCAGFNNILRALGSNIREDLTKSHSHYNMVYRHPIRIEKGTRLYDLIGAEEYDVNSLHTMVAEKERVEPYARISACSMDGLVECFEPEGKKFVIAIKWHPELMSDAYVDRLFEEFVNVCRQEGKENQ